MAQAVNNSQMIRPRAAALLAAAAREMGEIGAGIRAPARSVARQYDRFSEAWMETGEEGSACTDKDVYQPFHK